MYKYTYTFFTYIFAEGMYIYIRLLYIQLISIYIRSANIKVRKVPAGPTVSCFYEYFFSDVVSVVFTANEMATLVVSRGRSPTSVVFAHEALLGGGAGGLAEVVGLLGLHGVAAQRRVAVAVPAEELCTGASARC